MKKLAFAALLFAAVACSSSKHSASATAATVSGQDGSSYETAVVIRETSETAGVNAEYAWIRQHYPGSRGQGQALTNKNGKPYDVLTIVTADGAKKEVYFDISKFFGKF